MLNWIKYRKELLGRIGEISRIMPDTVKDYETLSTVTTGSLDARTRKLIALTVAVTTRCDGYVTVYTAEAIKHGITHEKIADTLSMAISLDAGAALVYSVRVLNAVQAYERA